MDFVLDGDDEDFFDPALSALIPWLETPLKAGSNTLRILRLHRGRYNDQISCSLFAACLDDQPEYETLSYVWGTASKTTTIMVSGFAFEATDNLVDFLRHLRKDDEDRMIWADAICIDQSSEREKEHQLKLMTRIYREGKAAHIWFGKFTNSWRHEIIVDSNLSGRIFGPSQTLSDLEWLEVEQWGMENLEKYLEIGGLAPQRESYTPGTTSSEIFEQSLSVLDCAAAGTQMHEFPLYLRHGPVYRVNRHWPVIMDCIRWMLTRPWWSRVWTYQEALLPKTDSVFHTSRHSVAFSRLLNGMEALRAQQDAFPRYIKHTYLFWAHYQDFPVWHYYEANHLYDARKQIVEWPSSEWGGISLRYMLEHSRHRKATDVRDHFLGMLGMLEPQSQSRWWSFSEQGTSRTAGQIFAQCTRLVLAEHVQEADPPNLDHLQDAIGCNATKVSDLPSWAIDLSSARSGNSVGRSRWHLYSACPGYGYKPVTPSTPLAFSELVVEGIKVGVVKCCVAPDERHRTRIPGIQERHGAGILGTIQGWQALYRANTKFPNDNLFWRTAFMDRNVNRFHMHDREPMRAYALNDIKAWWSHVEQTGGQDVNDVKPDRQYNDGRRGDYHYRELNMNTGERFFMTTKYEPGLGTELMQPGDEIFVLKGSRSPVILRRVLMPRSLESEQRYRFVGQCFVWKYMYGDALKMGLEWSTTVLI